ncbi:MAG TPA: diguanylate cyclase [Burkholderiales bacterium]|nr:diguanylate cyclase [Burkholderiales bacterium]
MAGRNIMKHRKTRSSKSSRSGPPGKRTSRRAPAARAKQGRSSTQPPDGTPGLRALLDLSAHWYWEQDEHLRFTYMSPGVERRLGLPAEAFLGKTRDAMAMFESESAKRRHLAALEARQPFEDVLVCQRRTDGKLVYARISGQPVFDEKGRFKGYRGVGRDVTAQVEAERALRESEARFRDLTELSSDWYWEQDENLRFTKMSGGVLNKLGWDPQSFIGKSRWDFPILVDEAALAEHKALLGAHKPFHDFVYGRRNPDGTVAYVSASGVPLFDEAGNFRGYRGVGRDITAQKLAEEALEVESRRLRRMVERLPAGAVCVEGDSLYINPRVEQMTGYTHTELPTLQAWFRALYPATSDEVWQLYQADRAAGFPVPRVVPATRKDGTRRLLEFAAYGDESSEVWLIQDVTDRVEAEARVRHAREQLHLALSGSRLALFEWNLASGEVYLSERWAEMLGEPPRPTRTTVDALRQLVHPEDLPGVERAVEEIVRCSTEFYDTEHRVRTPAGGWIWIRSRGQVVERDANARALRIAGTNADITQRKQAEESLREAHENLKRSVAALQRRNREIATLSELSNALLSCLAVEEACHVVPKYGEMLFPGERGALFLMRNSRDRLNPCATWGAPPIHDGRALEPEQCWALRRGRVHLMQDPSRDAVCDHAQDVAREGSPCLCLPLIVQSELIGLLWIAFRPGTRLSDERGTGDYGTHQLAVSLSEQMALALSNIRLRENLRQQTIRDPLTGLYNRRFLEEALEREIARCRRSATGFALLMIDVDHFKRFNDTYGHEAGDSVLRAVGTCLRASTRESDIVCRFGGEEFMIVLPDTALDGATTHARRILDCVRNLQLLHAGRALPPITVSAGVAMYPQNGDSLQSMVRSVDQALYAAKGAGRDRFVVAQ